jgi:hypothetical protein
MHGKLYQLFIENFELTKILYINLLYHNRLYIYPICDNKLKF